MKILYILSLVLISNIFFSQEVPCNPYINSREENLKFTNEEYKNYFKKKNGNNYLTRISSFSKKDAFESLPQYYNGSFEEHEIANEKQVVKGFYMYSITGTRGYSILQCTTESFDPETWPPSVSDTLNIPKYNFNMDFIATSVPSNFVDQHFGNIKATGQYALKINDENNYNGNACIVISKRIKSNNLLSFKYKVFLQYFLGNIKANPYVNTHLNYEPFFMARIKNKNGIVVDQFCISGDSLINNCSFKKYNTYYYNSCDYPIYNYYNPEWLTGNLNLSSISNGDEFIVEFISSRCGGTEHFSYVYIDDIV